MNIKTLVSAGIAALMASTALGQSLDPARVEIFKSVLKDNNCTLTESAASDILPRFNFTRDESRAIVGALVAAGDVRLDGSTLNLVDGSCDNTDPVMALFSQPDVLKFIGIMDENGCSMAEADAAPILTARGMSKAQVGAIVNPMIQAGVASFENGVLTINSDYCPVVAADEPVMVDAAAPTPTQSPAPMAAGQGGAARDVLLSVAAQNGCELDVNVDDSALVEAGLRMDQAYRIVDDLVAAGDASLSNEGALVSINPALCGSEMQPVEPQVQVPVPEAPPATPADTATTEQPAVANDDPRASVLAMLADNGCEITQANAADMIASAGLDYTTSMQSLSQMMASGEATSPDGGQTLQVGAPLCVAANAEPMTPREALIDLIKRNDCSITAAEFGNLLPYNGLDASTAFGMISALEAEGVISLPATRDVVTLSSEMCR